MAKRISCPTCGDRNQSLQLVRKGKEVWWVHTNRDCPNFGMSMRIVRLKAPRELAPADRSG